MLMLPLLSLHPEASVLPHQRHNQLDTKASFFKATAEYPDAIDRCLPFTHFFAHQLLVIRPRVQWQPALQYTLLSIVLILKLFSNRIPFLIPKLSRLHFLRL